MPKMKKVNMKLLFVCNANLYRSPTAAEIFKDKHETKSAGLSELAKIKVSKEILEWADKVYVMEEWMRGEIAKRFPEEYMKKKIINLDIPDVYGFMQDGLVKLLKGKVKV